LLEIEDVVDDDVVVGDDDDDDVVAAEAVVVLVIDPNDDGDGILSKLSFYNGIQLLHVGLNRSFESFLMPCIYNV